MTKIVESRKLKIRLQIEEKGVGSYGHETVATQELTVPLPVTRDRLLGAIGDQLDQAVAQVEIFRGTTVIEQQPEPIAAEALDPYGAPLRITETSDDPGSDDDLMTI